MVQHGNLVQPDVRKLLYRVFAAQRQARLSYHVRGRRISRRDRTRWTRDGADRLYRGRAVHEPRPAGHARSGIVAGLSRLGADQRDEADAQAEDSTAVIARALWRPADDPSLDRPLRARGARAGTR